MYLLGVAFDHVYYKSGVEKDRVILLHVPQCDTLMAFRRGESVRLVPVAKPRYRLLCSIHFGELELNDSILSFYVTVHPASES